jgi:hypothetical protein
VNGAIPAALIVSDSAIISSHVVGTCQPFFSNSGFEYQIA